MIDSVSLFLAAAPSEARSSGAASAVALVITLLLTLTIVVCIAQQFVRVRLGPLALTNIRGQAADVLVADFVTGVPDSRFGIPSGYFAVDTQRSSPGDLRFKERVMWKPALISAFQALRSRRLGGGPRRLGCLTLLLLPVLVYVVFSAPFVIVSEGLLKVLLRSRIRAVVEPLADGRVGSQVTFRFRGFSALGLRRQLRTAFDEPRLPDWLREQAAAGGSQ